MLRVLFTSLCVSATLLLLWQQTQAINALSTGAGKINAQFRKFLFQARIALLKRKDRGSTGYIKNTQQKKSLYSSSSFFSWYLFAIISFSWYMHIQQPVLLKGDFRSLTKKKADFLACLQSEPDVTAPSAFSVWLFQRHSASKLSRNFPCFYSGTNQEEQDQQPLLRKMGESERGADNREVVTY